MARTNIPIWNGAPEMENCMGRTCLQWRGNGELNHRDVSLVLQRLCKADPHACAILDAPDARVDP
jgi:hypothetical protein